APPGVPRAAARLSPAGPGAGPGAPGAGLWHTLRQQPVSVCRDRALHRAEPVFRNARGVSLDAVQHAASAAQRLGRLAPLSRHPADAATATGAGLSTAHESLWQRVSTARAARRHATGVARSGGWRCGRVTVALSLL